MIHITPMPDLFSEIFQACNITPLGKIVIGANLADMALNYSGQTEAKQSQAKQSQAKQSQQNQAQYVKSYKEAWSFYGEIMKAIQNSNNSSWWTSQTTCMKKKYLIQICSIKNKTDLIPFFERNIFPTL